MTVSFPPLVPGEAAAYTRQKINSAFATLDALVDISPDIQTAINEPPIRLRLDATPLWRPGSGPERFVSDIIGGENAAPSVPESWIITADRGLVTRLTGAAKIAHRGFQAIEPGRTYRARAVVQRRIDTPDPAGDAVALKAAWYAAPGDYISSTTLMLWDELTVSDGRVSTEKQIAASAGSGIDAIAPSSARYARLYVETWGTTQKTDVEVLALADVTDAELWSPDVSSLTSRIGAIESLDLGSRMAAIESEIGAASSLTFSTIGDFEAATIAATPDAVRVLGEDAPHDGKGSYWIRSDAMNGTLQSVDGAWWKKTRFDANFVICPLDFGAVGDGVADDAAAINAALDAIRVRVSFLSGLTSARMSACDFVFDGQGGTYVVSDSINATDITAWNLRLQNLVLIGKCTGKPMLDLSGSRGYTLSNIHFHGDRANMPSHAWVAARSATTGFSGGALYFQCSSDGHFSKAVYNKYAQESSKEIYCRWYQFNPDADAVAIHQGANVFAMTSEFTTLLTGSHSFIHNSYDHSVWAYIAVDHSTNVLGVTNALNAVITVDYPTPFEVGKKIGFTGVGMAGLDKLTGTITSIVGSTITTDIDTTALPTFSGGGIMHRTQTGPTLHIVDPKGTHYRDCYSVNFGGPTHIIFEFSELHPTGSLEDIEFEVLFEGSGTEDAILFAPHDRDCILSGFCLRTYTGYTTESIMHCGPEAGGSLTIHAEYIQSTGNAYGQDVFKREPGDTSTIYGGTAVLDSTAASDGFVGTMVTPRDTGIPFIAGPYNGYRAVVAAPLYGSFGAGGTAGFDCVQAPNNVIKGNLFVSVPDNGDGTGVVNVTMPYAPRNYMTFIGSNTVTKEIVLGTLPAGSTTLVLFKALGSYPVASGQGISMNVEYFVDS
ncbi:glycosyl hydrolase family 28-related protein [Ancylobacter pratisalsi]|uniref:Uncharacterized protein n=1 Tax=Ancylobacter pratisalsi TaxID=1745854 RepID=A0A6P1YH95_9HYPH|nr:glycosyl hydrolase family 28-related protein [Ancylobacter pratisalsi]QIB32629.1 hypothetical protein G3A50_02105 [Ancylobacter pratisalsi]